MVGNNTKLLVIGSDSSKLNKYTALISSIAKKEIVEQHLLDTNNLTLSLLNNKPPDILIVLLEQDNVEILKQLTLLPPKRRPALLVITDEHDAQLMRLSMHAGARDYFTEPVNSSEVTLSVNQIIAECAKDDTHNGILTTIINAKGGSGGSVLSCNLAHIAASLTKDKVLLLDIDLQFGTQSLLLDVQPKFSILDPLSEIDKLDSEALEGYLTKHKSGLRLLTSLHDQIILPGEIPEDQIRQFLNLSLKYFDRVFVDLPRQIDSLSTSFLEMSDQIVIVIQQSLAHLRDAKRLVRIMKTELNISEKNIIIVVNRYSAQSALQSKEIVDSLKCSNIINIYNDFERIDTTTNLGIPLFEYARNAPITKSVIELAKALNVDVGSNHKKSFFRGLLPNR